MAIFSKYVGMFGTLINSIVGTGNISVSTSAGVSTVDGSALATTTLNNLGTTAVNKNLNMAGTTTNADLLWNTAAGGSIGVGYSQTSGTDHRPKKVFVTDAVIVGSSGGLPPYGQNNALVTGSLSASNLSVSPSFSQTVMSGNSFWNSVAMGMMGFIKDGAGTAGAPGLINLASDTDRDIYFSLLYRTAPRSDLLKFAADGSLSLLKSSGANLLWATDGAGDIGSPDAGTTFKRPANLFLSNYAQIGNVVDFDGPSSGAGFIEVGSGSTDPNSYAFMGTIDGLGQVGFWDGAHTLTFTTQNDGTDGHTQAGQLAYSYNSNGFYLDAANSGIFNIGALGAKLWLGLNAHIDYTGDTMGINILHNGNNGIFANVLIAPHGSTALGSALLEVRSTTQGFLPPQMTTTQKNNILFPEEGLVVYDLTLHSLCFYNGTVWKTVATL